MVNVGLLTTVDVIVFLVFVCTSFVVLFKATDNLVSYAVPGVPSERKVYRSIPIAVQLLPQLIPQRVRISTLLSHSHILTSYPSLNSRQLLRSIAEQEADIMHTSIFDIHMDITLPVCTPSLPCHRQYLDLCASKPSMLPVVQVGGGTFSSSGMSFVADG